MEITNPLGSSRGKHKLGKNLCMCNINVIIKYFCTTALFYYTLGNLKPRLRANLKAIQLIAVVKHTHLKEYGLHSVLKPFIDDMNMLSKVYICVHIATYAWLYL